MLRSYTITGLYSYTTLQQDIFLILRRYYPLVRLKTLNITIDGRSIYCLKIGNPKGKNKILINASCHGREYMNSMLVMNQLKHILEGYYSKDYNKLFSNCELYIVPMLNPDGVSISQFGVKAIHSLDIKDRVNLILKSNGINHKYWKSNALGVDINRNFSTSYWNDFIDNTYIPSYKFFKGYSPTSEIETQTIQDLCTSLDNLKVVISYHSSGEEIYFDYGQTGTLKTDTLKLLEVIQNATGYSKAISSLNGVGLSDWIVEKLKIPAFTIETGIGECPLDIKEYHKVWNDNKNILIKIIKMLTL